MGHPKIRTKIQTPPCVITILNPLPPSTIEFILDTQKMQVYNEVNIYSCMTIQFLFNFTAEFFRFHPE